MIINQRIIDLFNYRIKKEEESSRLYLSMSVWAGINGLFGAEKLFKKYADEELEHAGWARQYLLDLNIQPVTPALDMQIRTFQGLPDIVRQTLTHEVDVTNQCQELAKACVEENDYMSLTIAQKYLKEQVDEIAKATYWNDRLEVFGAGATCIRLLDDEMMKHAG